MSLMTMEYWSKGQALLQRGDELAGSAEGVSRPARTTLEDVYMLHHSFIIWIETEAKQRI